MKKTTQLKIQGMSCTSCVINIERDLKRKKGVKSASVNFALETARIEYDTPKIKAADLIDCIVKSGYKAEEIKTNNNKNDYSHHNHASAESDSVITKRKRKLAAAIVLSLFIILVKKIFILPYEEEILLGAALLIILYSANEFFINGVPSLFKGRPGMNSLLALGVGTSFLYSAYLILIKKSSDEYLMDLAMISSFILLGRYLEERAKGKAGEAIKKLFSLSAKIAHKLKNKLEYTDISIDQIQVGDLLKVLPGEKIPTDGTIISGSATIDESMISGESIPVFREVNDRVIGATVNGNSSFTMKAQKVGSETMLAQIAKLVSEAQMSKAPIQKLADFISGYFVWGVIIIALITFFAWIYIGGVSASVSLIFAVSVLIVACPCALGLATPISVIVGSGKGAEMGILIKQSSVLEKAKQISAIAFDKTGTITEGKPIVQRFENLSGKKTDTLNIALSLEKNSEHPLSKSIVKYAQAKKAKLQAVSNFKAVSGKGVQGEINKLTYYLGSPAYIEELGILRQANRKIINSWEEESFSILILASNEHVLGIFAVSDQIKESSFSAIKQLKSLGIKTIMITGDNLQSAKKVATELKIDKFYSRANPADKKRIIQELQEKGEFVAMAGDGINDAPALMQADVGIAMGSGTEIAMESGDLVLIKGDLGKVVEAIRLSKATLKNIKQNLFWAFFYNTVGIPLAAFGLLPPAFSAGAMAFSSISVVLNALRLKRFQA